MTVAYSASQVAPSATTETTVYTVPALTLAKVVNVKFCNRGAAVCAFRFSHSVGGGATANKDYHYYDLSIAPNDTYTLTEPIFGNAGDVFRVYASTADLSVVLYAQETS